MFREEYDYLQIAEQQHSGHREILDGEVAADFGDDWEEGAEGDAWMMIIRARLS